MLCYTTIPVTSKIESYPPPFVIQTKITVTWNNIFFQSLEIEIHFSSKILNYTWLHFSTSFSTIYQITNASKKFQPSEPQPFYFLKILMSNSLHGSTGDFRFPHKASLLSPEIPRFRKCFITKITFKVTWKKLLSHYIDRCLWK